MNLRRFKRLFRDRRPSGPPPEVRARLLRYERERAERMAIYARAWERLWAEQRQARAVEHRSRFTTVR